MKGRWEEIVPIRGRSVDTRPIGKRGDDNELVTRVPLVIGGVAYAARLYKTDVVTYMPDGGFRLFDGAYQSASTSEMMNFWTPQSVSVQKLKNTLWVSLSRNDALEHIPLPSDTPVMFKPSRNDEYELVTPLKIEQLIINRKKMSEARATVAPFLAYATTMLKLCDGELDQEVVTGFPGISKHDWLYAARTGDAETYTEVLMSMVRSHGLHLWNGGNDPKYLYSPEALKSRVDMLLKEGKSDIDVWTTRLVDRSCIRDNIIVSLA
jgi:hypothetical protein